MYKFSPRRILSKSVFFLALTASANTFADVDLNQHLSNLPDGASLAFIAKNLSQDKIVADYQGQTFMLPASTQKVFTALAAKLALGDSFQFQTALLTNGKVQNGQLNGDLIVRFTGDPDLSSGQLFNLLSELKKQNINKINGNLILDTSVFTSHDRGLGWIWNDLTMCFNSPPAAVNIDNNCFYVDIDANRAPASR